MKLKDYIRLWFKLFANSLHRAAEYRLNFLGRIFVEACFISAQVLFALALSKGGVSVGGWTPMELLFFFGMVTFIDAFYMIFIHENLHTFQDLMRQGTFDFYLLRPLSSLYLSLLRFPSPLGLLNLFYSSGILIYALLHLETPVLWPNVLLGLFYSLVGFLLLATFTTTVLACGFFLTQTSALVWTFFEFYRLSFRPDDFYFSWLRRFLMSIFPAAFFISVPSKIFLGKELSVWLYIGPIVILIFSVFFVQKLWARGIRHYDGAMS